MAKDLWTAVAFISIATACHQAWSANMFTVASDAFPSRAVGSVVAAAGGAAAASLLALMGLALVYTSREVRIGAARPTA